MGVNNTRSMQSCLQKYNKLHRVASCWTVIQNTEKCADRSKGYTVTWSKLQLSSIWTRSQLPYRIFEYYSMFTQGWMMVSYRRFGTNYRVKSTPQKSAVFIDTAAEAWNRLFFLVARKDGFIISVYIASKFWRFCRLLISRRVKERGRDLTWNTLPVICLENGEELRKISLIVWFWTRCFHNT